MSLTFYDSLKAPSPRRIRLMLAAKNIPHDSVQIDLMTGEHMREPYRSINPDGTVPALKLPDGTVLTNVAACAAWLEATYPEPAMLGATPEEKAEIAGWVSRIEQELGSAIPNALRNAHPNFKDRALPGPVNYAQIPDLAQRGLVMIDAAMDKLNSHLKGKDYIAANQLSFADISAVCFLDFCRVMGKKVTDTHPELLRWRGQLDTMDAFRL